MHFTNSTLKFKVPRTLAVPDVNDQLLEGDRKLHFELSSEIGGELQRVTRSISFGRNSFRVYVVRERSQKNVNLTRECSQGVIFRPLSHSHKTTLEPGEGSLLVGANLHRVFVSLQKYYSPMTMQNKQLP